MDDTVRSNPLAPVLDPFDDVDESFAGLSTDVLERVWHFFISMRTGIALILALAVLSLIGTLLVQAPAGLTGDAESYRQWLEALRPKYGGWTNVFDTLGFFSLFNSIWFKGIVALLMTSIVACSVNRAPHLWNQATRPRLQVADAFFDRAALRSSVPTDLEDEAALSRAAAVLRRHHFRPTIDRHGDEVSLYADRFRWAPFGTVVAHLSLVLVLIGVVLGTTFGFRNSDFAAPIGSKVDVGFGTGLALEATSFSDSYDAETGAPSDYASDVVLYQGDNPVARQTIRVNQPLKYGDVTFYQSFFGPAASIHATDATGNVVFDQGVPLLYEASNGTERVGQFDLPDQGLRVLVVAAASGETDPNIKAGQVQVEVYPAGSQNPVGLQVIDQGKPATIGPLTVTFVREHQFTGLIVAKDPGAIFVWAGAIALMLGVCLVFFFPYRRLWARPRRRSGSTDVLFGAVGGHDVAFQEDFTRLIDELRPALDGQDPEWKGAHAKEGAI